MPIVDNSNHIKLLRLGVAAVLLLSIVDYMRLMGYEWGPGWDFKCNCDAAYTLFRGGNPYRSLDYSFIRNAFTYLPFWLPVHGALCLLLAVSDIKTTVIYYPLYVGLFLAAVQFAIVKGSFSRFDRALFAAITLGGLNGFLWIARTGNIAIFDTIFFLCALVALLKFCETRQDSLLRLFAVLFGAFMAIKTATIAFALLIAFIPASPRQRLQTAAIAVGIALLPLVISYAFYSHLMPQYYLMLANKIEGNVNPHICSPSLYCFFRDIALVPSKLPLQVELVRVLSQAAPTLLMACAVLYAMGRRNGEALLYLALRAGGRRWPAAFKGTAFDGFLFGFLFLQILMPRFKEYTFGLAAIAFAFLVVRLPGSPREKIALAAYLAFPVIDFFDLVASNGSQSFGYYLQLYVTVSAFLFLLVRYCHVAPAEREGENAHRETGPVAARAGHPTAVTVGAFAGLAMLGTMVLWLVSEPFHTGGDAFRAYYPANDFFRGYYAAGAAVWGNAPTLRELVAIYDFVNLPIIAVIFAPLGLLGKYQAALVYLALGVVATAGTVILLSRLSGSGRLASLALACLFLLNGPLIYSFKEGNSSHIILFMLVGALVLLRREAHYLAGAVLGLAAVIKPPLLLLGLYFLVRQRWRVFAGGGAVVSGCIVLSLVLFGTDLNQLWLERCILPFVGRPVHAFNMQSFDGFLMRWHFGADFTHGWGPNDLPAPYIVARWILTGAVLAIAAGAIRRVAPRDESIHLSILITVAIIISPVTWTHYYSLLLLPWGLYVTGALRGDAIAHGLMSAGIVLASPPAAHIPLHGSWRETIFWQLLSSSWLWGGLLTFAALVRCLPRTSPAPRPLSSGIAPLRLWASAIGRTIRGNGHEIERARQTLQAP